MNQVIAGRCETNAPSASVVSTLPSACTSDTDTDFSTTQSKTFAIIGNKHIPLNSNINANETLINTPTLDPNDMSTICYSESFYYDSGDSNPVIPKNISPCKSYNNLYKSYNNHFITQTPSYTFPTSTTSKKITASPNVISPKFAHNSLPTDHNYCIQSTGCSLSTLKCMSLNVNGLLSKLKFNDFLDYLHSFDLIGISETKLDNYDDINLENFNTFSKNRQKYRHKSGGIVLLVKNNISKYIEIIPSKCNDILWFSINQKLLGFKLICGIVYIPPEGSPYHNVEIFNDVETELSNIKSPDSEVCIFGDTNARTSSKSDFVTTDPFTTNNVNADSFPDLPNTAEFLEFHGLPLKRKSQDKCSNNLGYKLLKFCKSSGLCIANGRLGDDRYIGKTTCKNVSVVDYVIASPKILTYLTKFSIADFNTIFSYVHCAIEFNLKSNPPNVIPGNTDTSTGENYPDACQNIKYTKQWNESIEKDYLSHLLNSSNTIQALNTDMENLLENLPLNQNQIDNFAERFSKIILSDTSLLYKKKFIKHSKPSSIVKPQNPWYNNVCHEAKKKNYKARTKYHNFKCEANLADLKLKSKDYKKTVKNQFNAYNKGIARKLRNLRSNNCKEYWRVINNIEGNKNTKCNISAEALFEHFNNLNSTSNDSEDPNQINIDEINRGLNNDLINDPFTNNEIEKAIKSLKNNKAHGID